MTLIREKIYFRNSFEEHRKWQEKQGKKIRHDLHFYVLSMKTEMEKGEYSVDCISSIIQKLFDYFQTKSVFYLKIPIFFLCVFYHTVLLARYGFHSHPKLSLFCEDILEI